MAFIHDELLVEMPDEGGFVTQARAEAVVEIIRDSMQELTADIPVGCEYSLATCWSKSAELICEDGKIRPWKPPSQ